MRTFITYLKDFLRNISIPAFITVFLFLALLVTLNYTGGIESRLISIRPGWLSLLTFYFFFSAVLFFAWAIQLFFQRVGSSPRFGGASPVPAPFTFPKSGSYLLLLLAPLYFAAKMVHWDLSFLLPQAIRPPWDRYTLIILQLPAKLLLLLSFIYTAWRTGLLARASPAPNKPQNGWTSVGLTTRNFNARPYFLLLLLLVPVVALASTRPDFLRYYPKVRAIGFLDGYANPLAPWRLLYELSYGLDFFSIELFFRGLLVVGLGRLAGEQAILPMAAFYCTVHFGKPMGECITSFFGGLVLGVLAYRTRSILGGLIVHLGLAWMMELGGWLGALFPV